MKSGFKKMAALCIAFAMLILLFEGCGQTQQPATSQETKKVESTTAGETAKVENITVKVLTVTQWWDKGLEAVAVAAPEKIGLTLEVEKLPDGQGDQVIKTRIATNEMPDIMLWYGGANLKVVNPEQNFVDLSNEPYASVMVDSAKMSHTINGKLYGVPFTMITIGGVFYNKKVYSDLGLQIPKTWAELISNCEKIKAAGKVPVFASYKDDWSAQLVNIQYWYYAMNKNPQAAELYNTNKLKLADIPEFVSSFEKLQELKTKGFINEDYMSATYDNAQKAIANGDAAMYAMDSSFGGYIVQNYPDKANDVGAFALPGDDAAVNGTVIWPTSGMYLPIASKNRDAVKKWFAFWTSRDGQGIYQKNYAVSGGIPFKGIEMPADLPGCVSDLMKYTESGNASLCLEGLTDIALGSDLPKICVEAGIGAKTPLEAAKAVDAAAEKYAKAKNLQGW